MWMRSIAEWLKSLTKVAIVLGRIRHAAHWIPCAEGCIPRHTESKGRQIKQC